MVYLYGLQVIIVLLVLCIVFYIKAEKLSNENTKLKYELWRLKNNNNSNNEINSNLNNEITNTPNYTYNNTTNQINNFNYNDNSNSPNLNSSSKAKNKQNQRNTLILISGATLVILSAIVFLLSTWNSIPELLKTATLSMLIVVFLGFSKIAKEKFKLESVANTFYYIALAYIPIVLISISFFKLLGNYLSLYGDGSNLYFSVSAICLAIIYGVEYYKNKLFALKIINIIFEFIAVIFTVLIFTNDFSYIFVGICAYDFIYNILTYTILGKDNIKHDIASINCIILYILSIILVYFKFYYTFNLHIIDIVTFLFLTFNYYLLRKENKANLEFFNISIILTVLTSLAQPIFYLNSNVILLAISITILIVYLLNYIKSKTIIYKIIVYSTLNLLGVSILLNINYDFLDIINSLKYVFLFTTVLVFLIEKNCNRKDIKVFLFLLFTLTLVAQTIGITLTSFISLLAIIILFIAFTRKNTYLLPACNILNSASLIIPLFISKVLYIHDIDFRIILSFAFIALTTIKSAKQNKLNEFIFISIAYILLACITFNLSTYIFLFIMLTWSILHIICYTKNDVFKCIFYLTGLALYNKCIYDLSINNITIINLIGYIITLTLITRTIIQKYSSSLMKVIEYISLCLINIIALCLFLGMKDALVYNLVLFLLIVISYYNKYGPMFLISLIFIVVNGFLLTKEFWQSIPWWIYLLIIGLSLITFAIRVELKDIKEKNSIVNRLRSIKEKIDL